MKHCIKCGSMQDLSAFHKDATKKDGYRSCCKTCVAAYMRHNYSQNKDAIKARVYKWIEENRERHNAKCAKWVKNNPGKVNARTARRYAAKTGATPAWLSVDDKWLMNEAYALAKLRTQTLGIAFEVDHIVPLRGKKVMGLHVPWNLRVVPTKMNRVKSNSFKVA